MFAVGTLGGSFNLKGRMLESETCETTKSKKKCKKPCFWKNGMCIEKSEDSNGHNCFTKEMWSDEKKEWCCKMKDIGCPDDGPKKCCKAMTPSCLACMERITEEEFCEKVLESLVAQTMGVIKILAQEAKKKCKGECFWKGKGKKGMCIEKSEDIDGHNCFTKEMWSDEKKEWCCKMKDIGCPDDGPMCCKAMTPSCLACMERITEEEFCEKNPGKFGCPDNGGNEDSCAGKPKKKCKGECFWKGKGKKGMCIEKSEDIDGHNCFTREMWSDEKKEWCCEMKDIGCPEDGPKKCCKALTPSCLACMEGITEEEFCEKSPGKFGCPDNGGDEDSCAGKPKKSARESAFGKAKVKRACVSKNEVILNFAQKAITRRPAIT